ncbi:MAG: hypothetical protein ACK5LV_07580 [Lachnospirales bacterium]
MREIYLRLTIKIVVLCSICLIAIVLLNSISIFQESEKYSSENIIKVKLDNFMSITYAIEGEFPEDLTYFEKYGLFLDEDNYIYEYNKGESGRPKINVIKK